MRTHRYGLITIATLVSGCMQADLPDETGGQAESALVTPGTFTQLPHLYPGPGGPRHIQLLMDGTILASDGGTNTWRRMTPDPVSGYVGGTWTTVASPKFERTFFATGILLDGRYFIGGGEFVSQNGTALPNTDPNRSHCEIYDPNANFPTGSWLSVPDYPNKTLGDGVVSRLPNGKLLVGGITNSSSLEFDPSNLSAPWGVNRVAAPTLRGGAAAFGEGSLASLQNGDVFLAESGGARYSFASQTWTTIPVPAGYRNPFGNVPGSIEGGPALTLYSGNVMMMGATGFNAMFFPRTNTIANIANTPGAAGSRFDENDQVVLPNGNVLCAVIDKTFSGMYSFFEFQESSNSFTPIPIGAPAFTAGNMLMSPLPDGSALVANAGSRTLFVYRHAGPQLTSFGRPMLTSVTGPSNGVFTLTGTNLNGLTNGANRDDEGQNYTSFPIVSVSNGGITEFCTVRSVSTGSIQPGATVTVTFTLPPIVPSGPLQLAVAASGLRSANTLTIEPQTMGDNGAGRRYLLLN